MEALDEAERDLAEKQEEYRALYDLLPESRGKSESAALEKAFASYDRLLDRFREQVGSEDESKEKIEELTAALKRLKSLQFDFRESVWAHRGPSTQPGLNELLGLLADRKKEAILLHIDREWVRLKGQLELLDTLPDFLKPIVGELLSEYRGMLHTTVELLEADGDWSDLEELREQFVEWGDEYSCHDLGGLYRKYSDLPTAFPDVNFALNARLLYLDGYIIEELSDHAFSEAARELKRAAKWVAADESLESPQQVAYLRCQGSLEGILSQAKSADTAAECRELGQACLPIVAEMRSYQRRFSY
jgi:hypothetical protein